MLHPEDAQAPAGMVNAVTIYLKNEGTQDVYVARIRSWQLGIVAEGSNYVPAGKTVHLDFANVATQYWFPGLQNAIRRADWARSNPSLKRNK